jgi:pantothenate kinase
MNQSFFGSCVSQSENQSKKCLQTRAIIGFAGTPVLIESIQIWSARQLQALLAEKFNS